MNATATTVFCSPKGGQGCTTAAAVTAIRSAADGEGMRTLLISHNEDVLNFLGNRSPKYVCGVYEIGSKLDVQIGTEPLTGPPGLYDRIIIDAGTNLTEWMKADDVVRVMVLRNCYLAASAAVRHQWDVDSLLIVEEAGRALSPLDVAVALGKTEAYATLRATPEVARVIDAGLLGCSTKGLNW